MIRFIQFLSVLFPTLYCATKSSQRRKYIKISHQTIFRYFRVSRGQQRSSFAFLASVATTAFTFLSSFSQFSMANLIVQPTTSDSGPNFSKRQQWAKIVIWLFVNLSVVILGGFLFQWMEGATENTYQCGGVKKVRRDWVDDLWSQSQSENEWAWKSSARQKLHDWEQERLLEASGVKTYSSQTTWNLTNAIIYTISLMTTIGNHSLFFFGFKRKFFYGLETVIFQMIHDISFLLLCTIWYYHCCNGDRLQYCLMLV